jgi:hypothetical protein
VQAVQQAHPHDHVELWTTDQHRLGLKPILRRVWCRQGPRPTAVVQPRSLWCDLYAFVHPPSGRTCWLLLPTVSIAAFTVALIEFAQAVGARAPAGRALVAVDERTPGPSACSRSRRMAGGAGASLSDAARPARGASCPYHLSLVAPDRLNIYQSISRIWYQVFPTLVGMNRETLRVYRRGQAVHPLPLFEAPQAKITPCHGRDFAAAVEGEDSSIRRGRI